jgi:hypothetical protein
MSCQFSRSDVLSEHTYSAQSGPVIWAYWATAALETANAQNCEDYPLTGSVNFEQITVRNQNDQTLTPDWTSFVVPNDCSLNAEPVSSSWVRLSWLA